jgi:LmbE family N-acetylglucosaminyl deacetylase
MNLALIPHNDDESLFLAYTLMRERPQVVIVFDSYIQYWTTNVERRQESIKALSLLGITPIFLGLNERTSTEDDVRKALMKLKPNHCYAPSGSHHHHQLIGKLAQELYNNVTIYTTYEGTNYLVEGKVKITPTIEEINLKNKMLDCYKSQLIKNAPHFEAVRGKPEYYA